MACTPVSYTHLDVYKRQVYDAGLHVLKAGERPCLFDGGLGHGKFIVAALEVVVAQDAAAHDGQVSVAAHEDVYKRQVFKLQ